MSQRLLSDPENTIVSITNTLDYFHLKYVVAEVPKTAISELPNIFIAQVSDNKNSNLIIVERLNEKLKIRTNYSKNTIVDYDTFIENWTGFILVIEENKKQKITSNISNGFRNNAFLIVSLVLGLLFVYFSTFSLSKSLYFILSFIGVFISVLIFKGKINSNNQDSRFCSIITNSSCKSVLNSSASKIFGLELVDACIVYFIFTTLIFVYNPNTSILLLSGLASIPVIIYSIYQQYFKIKSWCPLCLIVSLILTLHLLIVLSNDFSFSFNEIDIIFSLFTFVIIINIWSYFKPYAFLIEKVDSLSLENLKFRRNHYLFLPYFNQLKEISMSDNILGRISIGSNNPILRLTLILNPECKYCFEAHKMVMNIVKQNRGKLMVDFRFFMSFTNNQKQELKICERLLEIYDKNGRDAFMIAYNEQYQIIKDKWLLKWGVCLNKKYRQQLKNHETWCSANNIESTPRFLINQKLIPENYRINDIEHLIESIMISQKKRN